MQSIYRAERPETFGEIIGQSAIVRILQNQLKEGTINHAYLFAGLHGTGKTSTARIFAKALNCSAGEIGKASASKIPCGKCESCLAIKDGRLVDVIEIDAASNNGVEDLRSIIETVKYPPSIGKYKVYIIDEVHMLSQSAENAFLKTLEEPPEYAIFILATTDPDKVRSTIRSRCLDLSFRRISDEEMLGGLKRICDKYNVTATQEALGHIVRNANGSVRDALSLLEECMASSREINIENVLELSGSRDEMFFAELCEFILKQDASGALQLILQAIADGCDARQLLNDWLLCYRNLLICKILDKPDAYIGLSHENSMKLIDLASRMGLGLIQQGIDILNEYQALVKYSDRPQILLEAALVKLSGYNSYDVNTASQTVTAKQEKKASPEPRAYIIEEAKPKPKKELEKKPATEPQNQERGLPQEIWEILVREVSKQDSSFEPLVARASQAIRYENDLLTVYIRKNKLMFAKSFEDKLIDAGRKRYGSNFSISLQEGDINPQTSQETEANEQSIKELEEMLGKSIEIIE